MKTIPHRFLILALSIPLFAQGPSNDVGRSEWELKNKDAIMAFQKMRDEARIFHRDRFEAIVQEVRSRGLKPGEIVTYKTKNLSDPKSLEKELPSPAKPRRTGRRESVSWKWVWAEMSPDNKLKVVIETLDFGHAGETGFAYSESGLKLKDFQLDVPSHLKYSSPEEQIDQNWWRVYYNLD